MSALKEITKVETQKRNKKRRSIYLDGEYAFGIDEELVLQFGLYQGNSIDMAVLGRVLEAQEYKSARDNALRFLGYRARSEREVRDKLTQSGYTEETIESVIADLKRQKFIDDAEFAALFVRDKLRTRPVGQHLLKHDLKQKGLSDKIIENALSEAYREKTQFELAKELAAKKEKSDHDLENPKKKKRIIDFLLRRGFDWEIVTLVMEDWQR